MEKQNIINTSTTSWVRGTCVGKGSYGSVHTAINKSNGEVFAVKSVDLATCLPTQLESLENEISILRSLKPHPYIVKFLGDGVSKEARNLYLEYLPESDVANYSPGGIKDESLVRRFTACLVSALRFVHSQGIVHCDVKAKNVLVSQSSMIKLADFGSAVKINKSTCTAEIMPRGSPLWMAPEVVRCEYQGPESDVWSIGCTVIEMFTGKPGWEDQGIDSLSRIGFSDELPVFPTNISEVGCDFLKKCLKRDVNQRWSCDQLLQHPFIAQCQKLSSTESSPRCVLDWVNSGIDLEEEEEVGESDDVAAMERISKLAMNGGAIWESDGWVEVRRDQEGTTMEYSESIRVEPEFNTSSGPYDDVADNSVYLSPNSPPQNRDSATALPYELVVIMFLLQSVSPLKLFLLFSCCYQYHRQDNNNMELKMLSFNLSLNIEFCLSVNVIRIEQNYLLRGEMRLSVLIWNCFLLLVSDLAPRVDL